MLPRLGAQTAPQGWEPWSSDGGPSLGYRQVLLRLGAGATHLIKGMTGTSDKVITHILLLLVPGFTD